MQLSSKQSTKTSATRCRGWVLLMGIILSVVLSVNLSDYSNYMLFHLQNQAKRKKGHGSHMSSFCGQIPGPFGDSCSNQKAREFARSRSHRPASFCWCVREAAPCTPRNSTLLSCTHMPGNCPKNVKQGLLQNVFFATDSVLKVKDSGRKHRNSCLLPLKY